MVEPDTGEPYERDPRGTAEKAEAYLKSSGIGDTAYFGPEAEFFLFDDVRFSETINKVSYESRRLRRLMEHRHRIRDGQHGPPPGPQGRLFPGQPDRRRAGHPREMLSTMKRLGMKVDKHHHEVASCQHELGLIFGTLTTQADEHPEIQVRHPQRRPRLWQVGHVHAQAHLGRQRLGHAREHVDLEGRQAAVRRRQICRPEPGGAVVHRRHPEARQGAERASPTPRPTATSA